MTEQDPLSQQIHGFSDASEKAYAAVIYLRSMYGNGRGIVCIITSKYQVAIVKTQTIPRLELLGATILSYLMHTVLQNLFTKLDVYYCTDSLTVLCWITNNCQWKQYVQNCVQEIHKMTKKDGNSVQEWKTRQTCHPDHVHGGI